MDDKGNTREDLKLPTGTEEAEKLALQLKNDFADGKELVVGVLKVRRGHEVVEGGQSQHQWG